MKSLTQIKTEKRIRRHSKIRSKICGTAVCPRLSVSKSNKDVFVQIIDDTKGETLASSSAKQVKGKNLLEKSLNAGKDIAKKAIEKKIEKVVFDRGGYVYTGKIKAVADGAREGGLKF